MDNNRRLPNTMPPIKDTGLENYENNCYINSITQCMSHTVPLWQRLLRESHLKEPCSSDACLLCCFWELMNAPLGAKGSIGLILDKLEDFSKNFKRNAHEDAHEFFTSVFSKFLDQFRDVFEGSLTTTRVCNNCGASSANPDFFNTLMLNIVGVASLDDALANYVKGEPFQTKCVSCREDDSTEKHDVIFLPPVVVLMMKRFILLNGNTEKYNNFIPFPLQIDFGQHMRRCPGQKYFLYAFIEHYGTPDYGHYNAYIRVSANNWYNFNDRIVTETLESDVLKRKPYLLFYARFGTDSFSAFMAQELRNNGGDCVPGINRGDCVRQPIKDVNDGELAPSPRDSSLFASFMLDSKLLIEVEKNRPTAKKKDRKKIEKALKSYNRVKSAMHRFKKRTIPLFDKILASHQNITNLEAAERSLKIPPLKEYSIEERELLVRAMRKPYGKWKWLAVKKEFFANSHRSAMNLMAQWHLMIRLALGENDESGKKRVDFLPDELAENVLSIEINSCRGSLLKRGEMKKRLAVLKVRKDKNLGIF